MSHAARDRGERCRRILLAYLKDRVQAGSPPRTMVEIGTDCGFTHTAAARYMRRLRRMGVIDYDPFNSLTGLRILVDDLTPYETGRQELERNRRRMLAYLRERIAAGNPPRTLAEICADLELGLTPTNRILLEFRKAGIIEYRAARLRELRILIDEPDAPRYCAVCGIQTQYLDSERRCCLCALQQRTGRVYAYWREDMRVTVCGMAAPGEPQDWPQRPCHNGRLAAEYAAAERWVL